MTQGGSVSDLRAGIDQGIAEIGRLQSALSLAKDRNQQTVDVLKRATHGSTRDETAEAIAALTSVDASVDAAIGASLVAVEQLQIWASTL